MFNFIPLPKDRTYVNVDVSFDRTGHLHPKSVTWTDGKTYPVQKIQDCRPGSKTGMTVDCDCYTVVINGNENYLFFERTDPRFNGRFGRWFVEGDGASTA